MATGKVGPGLVGGLLLRGWWWGEQSPGLEDRLSQNNEEAAACR